MSVFRRRIISSDMSLSFESYHSFRGFEPFMFPRKQKEMLSKRKPIRKEFTCTRYTVVGTKDSTQSRVGVID